MIDLTPAAERMQALLESVSDTQFVLGTPCPDARVGDLIDHVGTFASRFTSVARKADRGGPPPRPSAANLEPEWRDRIVGDLRTLAEAWREPAAWDGMTVVGGLEVPCEVAGLVALDELVVHGWDISIATGLEYEPSAADIHAARSFVESFDAPRDGKLFGPIVSVPTDASPLHQLLGLTGRDPSWTPTSD